MTTWRPLTRDDVPAWARLLAAAEAVDRTGEHYGEDDLHEEIEDPSADPELRRGAFVDGELVAYVALRPRARTAYWRINGEGAVHPDHRGRGLGWESLAWAEAATRRLRDEQQAGAEARVHISGAQDNGGQEALLRDAGYAPVNWSAGMTAELTSLPPGRPVPPGFTIASVTRDWSARLLDAHNDAFLDHWGFAPWTEAEWTQWELESRSTRPELSLLAVADDAPDRVAGYLLTHEYDADTAATGRRDAYIAKVGVRREHRGRGLAAALLRRALAGYRDAGFETASLDVDTNNPTGAFGLYEGVGFVIEHRHSTYELVLPAGRADSERVGAVR